MRILGIDYGKKKIGLAFAESDVKLALPLDVVPNLGAQTIMEIAKRIRVDDIDLIVIGMPGAVSNHGNEKQIAIVRSFITELQKQTAVPIMEEDESFTTAESQRLMREEEAVADEDALAAMIIVQSYLNRV